MNGENKEQFISTLETALIMYSRERITGMKYRKDKPSGMEFVDISFVGGAVKHVNVSCDSCIAMMKDIYKALI